MAENRHSHRVATLIAAVLIGVALAPLYVWPLLPILVIVVPLIIILGPVAVAAWREDRDDHTHHHPVT